MDWSGVDDDDDDDVFMSCLDANISDGTHSLQMIHWW